MNENAAPWPLPVRLIHWVSAALIVGALGLGAWMVELIQDPARRFDLTQMHKSIGVAVLALTAVRLCLRILTTPPKPLPAAAPVRLAAKANHVGLYGLLLLLPLSGWLMATTAPVRVPTIVFGLFTLPYPLLPDLPTYKFAHAVHVGAAVVLMTFLVLHVAAALVHALWWRDGILARMWWKQAAGRRAGQPKA
jgi:cytochrome b561